MKNLELSTKLAQTYGENIVSQEERYEAAIGQFRALYGSDGPIHIFRAPGRVNLIGEHTDYNHGYVLPAALDKDVLLLARPRSDSQVHLANAESAYGSTTFILGSDIPQAKKGDWSNYARGAGQVLYQYMATHGYELHGMDGLVVSLAPAGVPKGAGLSSSTALTVVIATGLLHDSQQKISPSQVAQLCSDAEWYVGTRGGIMDQFASLFARQGHAMFLDCRPTSEGDYQFQHTPLPDGYQLLVVDSNVHHENAGNEFNQRVAACRAGVALLQRSLPTITHLRDVQEISWALLKGELPEQITLDELNAQGIDLGDIPGLKPTTILRVQARCRHVWTENQRVRKAITALRTQNVTELGESLHAAHASARDDYEISCPEVEVLIEAANQVEGVVGSRLTGAGWGGCIIALVHENAVKRFQQHVRKYYRELTRQDATIFACRAGPGAGKVVTL